ncbi:nucleotidyl transferase AbiEii/AbiGii toxin family protein [Thiohalophilus sp.]|uniref:nucleotidyl transferase AbiEii/AbiGii toxin family protein n=1 Tax=Thiohalophilus sp. TaxID=3028392 RepID=UPI002ACEFB3A|nr:nucleotidyl transferase AbiEii/AbiGii toxin family protein [Thiohalophilus sp.]MDZ7803630.1 nucleotidyl transferase AbiEii/AbiGii toxin family protein [Thiohalophilus sp.]
MFGPDNPYYARVRLLVRVLPQIAREPVFALKGGTAINLFVRDMPRLSVDIDLVYLPLEPRDEALANIQVAMDRIGERIAQSLPDARVDKLKTRSGMDCKILVHQAGEEIVIETSPVMRGVVNSPSEREVSKPVEEVFGYTRINVSSLEDLYAGKLCAALDRQHPRDLFDVKVLYEHEGLTRSLHEIFLIYLLCGNRPVSEMLQPKFQELRSVFEAQFVGMSLIETRLEELEAVREKLVGDIHARFTDAQKQFLLSFKQGEPDWELLNRPGVEKLPAIQWKLHNIRSMSGQKHKAALAKLEKVLYG